MTRNQMTGTTGTRAGGPLRSAFLVAFATAVPGLLAGCDSGASAGDSAGPSAGVTVRDSAGIEIVENHAPERPEGQFWTMDPEPAFVLGGIATGAESESGRDDLDGAIWGVRGLAMLVDGRIAVLSQGNHKVFIFDTSGRLSREFGSRGEGPASSRSRSAYSTCLRTRSPCGTTGWGPLTVSDQVGLIERIEGYRIHRNGGER